MSLLARLILGVLLVTAICASASFADVIEDDPEAVSLYARGKRMLREGDWLQASQIFEELAGRFSQSANLDLFVFNRSKAVYYLGEYDNAIAGFTFFIRRFDGSRYIPYACFYRGNAYYRDGNASKAIESYLDAYSLSTDKRLDQILHSSMQAAFRNAGSVSLEWDDLLVLAENKRCKLVKLLSEVYAEQGEFRKAEVLLARCNLTLDESAKDNFDTNKHRQGFEIAMVLPFSGELHSFGQSIYNGAVIAAELFRQETNKNIRIVPYDTKGDPIDAAQIIAELSQSFTTDAAIGPLTSEEAAVTSASLSCGSLPLIVPAATQAGLTRLSETSFQLSPNIELEGIRMAEYAVSNLQADSAAVITSTSSDHLRMARAFSDRFQQLGGTLVAVEYYRPRDKDFGKIIRDIKGLLLGGHPDSVFYINERGDTLDPDEVSANLNCLFLPGNSTQLRQLIPQLNFYSLNAFYLGSDGWGDEIVLKLGDNNTKGAIFPSPFLSAGSSDEYFQFATLYDARFGEQPSRLANLGYDAAKLITLAIANGAGSKDDIINYLRSITDYKGASGKISFGKHRENMEMPLYRIELEQAIPLNQPEEVPVDVDTSGTG